jgi:SET domain-containing protein
MGERHLTVKKAATGHGLFATAGIERGRKIVEYTGPLLTNDQANARGGKFLMRLSNKLVIDGSPRSNLARFINHSCHPNAEALISGRRIWIWSIRSIEAGEEITIDYGPEYFDDHIRPHGCKCRECGSRAITADKGVPRRPGRGRPLHEPTDSPN